MKRMIEMLITWYQQTLSPDHGMLVSWRFPYGYCRYAPSCSEYARQAFVAHSLSRAFFMSCSRIIRCMPLSKGGHDPVKR